MLWTIRSFAHTNKLLLRDLSIYIAVMFTLATHVVADNPLEARLSDYCVDVFAAYIPSRKGIKKAIKRELMYINGAIATTGRFVKRGDIIELKQVVKEPHKGYFVDFQIVYEDDSMAIINKPAGIDVSGNKLRTIQNALGTLVRSEAKDALAWPQPAHRLDNQTSGLLVIAKTASKLIELGRQFEQRSVRKRYHAVVMGSPEPTGYWKSKIEGKPSRTTYRVIRTVRSLRSQCLSLLELYPETGRTHQLRIHCSESGYPILGDKLYGPEGNTLKHKGLFLAATGLIFEDGSDFQIKPPAKFDSFMKGEARRYNKYH